MRKHNKFRYRSGLEKEIAAFLKSCQKELRYELLKIEWEDLRYRHYTPDFILDNGIIIETKGMFDSEDRRKHLCIKKQYPKLDIRFVLVMLTLNYIRKLKVDTQIGAKRMIFCMHIELFHKNG